MTTKSWDTLEGSPELEPKPEQSSKVKLPASVRLRLLLLKPMTLQTLYDLADELERDDL